MNPYKRWIPIGLLLLAFGLQLYALDAQDIWGDEAWSIAVSQMPLGESIFRETNPPFYFLALRAARALWGSTPFALRYLSVVCGVLTVAIIGRIAHTLDPKIRSYALLAAAVSPISIYYAQEARMYGPMLVGGAGSLLAFLILLRSERRGQPASLGWWAIYVVCSLIGIFTHFYAFAVLIGQAAIVALLMLRERRWQFVRRMGLMWGGMAALFVPYFVVHRSYWDSQQSLRAEEWNLAQLLEIGRRTLVAFGAGVTISAEQQILGWVIVAIALIGAIWLLRQQTWQGGTLIALVAAGIFTGWLLTPLLPFFWERYLLAILPPFIVLVGAGLASMTAWHKLAPLPLAVGLIGISLFSTWQYRTLPQYDKGGYGQTMAIIEERMRDGDLILLNGPLQASLFDYYRPDGIDGIIIDRERLLDVDETEMFFRETVGENRRVWLVASGNPLEFDPEGKAANWLAQNGSFAFHKDFPGIGLDLFVMQAPTEPQVALDVNFGGEILLTGYALESDSVQADEAVVLTLFWQAQRPLENAYTVFTHVLDANGQIVAQVDRQPQGGSRPTNSWAADETVRDSYAIVLPLGLEPGTYTIQVGLYLWPELTRLSVDQSDRDTFRLADIRVK